MIQGILEGLLEEEKDLLKRLTMIRSRIAYVKNNPAVEEYYQKYILPEIAEQNRRTRQSFTSQISQLEEPEDTTKQ